MPLYIKKASGAKEQFDIKKLRRSLRHAGADSVIITKVIDEIKKRHPRTTRAIHELTIDILTKEQPHIAARYNIKKALMQLGPAGYPFEQFVAEIFKAQGYAVSTNQIIEGKCVDHEVDVIAQKGDKHYLIETKFHNRAGIKTNIKATLYIQSRFEDIRAAWNANPKNGHEFHQGWVVTNTKFTTEAIKYGVCMNINLLGWKYPFDQGIAELIDSLGLHPITALTTLTPAQKKTIY